MRQRGVGRSKSGRHSSLPEASTGPRHHADPQADVITLLEGRAFGSGETMRRIDTHAARVFLVGDRAWKLKRAVQFDYLDFSTADRRRAALEAELRLNRRTAPELYLAVRPVSKNSAGCLNLDGDGEPVDWLLEMRRFPDDALLDHVATQGGLTDVLITQLADRIKAFHDGAETCLSGSGRSRLEAVIAGNDRSMARFPDILPARLVRDLIDRQVALLAQHSDLLDSRARSGRVRHGHGDLHLGNIAVIDGSPVLFDCLEFSPELATGDVLYDLAFLLMDLWGRGLHCEANALFNRYLDISPQDDAGVALVPLFLSIRAGIRAHTSAAQASDGSDEALTQKASAYLTLARAVLEPVPARLVAIGGLSGSGKSTIAKLIGHSLGEVPGARILRSDVLRKRLAGVPPESPLPKDAYTLSANAAIYTELRRLAGHMLYAGHSVVADAVHAKPEERTAIQEVALRRDARFDGIWLNASPDMLTARVSSRTHDASDANAAVVAMQTRYDLGHINWHRVNAADDRKTVATQVMDVLDVRHL